MEVKFKKFSEDARIPELAHDTDFCYDCYAVSEEEIAPNVWKYGLGFGLQVERGYENIMEFEDLKGSNLSTKIDTRISPIHICVDFRCRSSVWKTGMVLSNAIGTIDEGYTGEISAVFYHVMPNLPRYKVGDKIIQCTLNCALPMSFKEVNELEKTDRGDSGYGDSDKINK